MPIRWQVNPSKLIRRHSKQQFLNTWFNFRGALDRHINSQPSINMWAHFSRMELRDEDVKDHRHILRYMRSRVIVPISRHISWWLELWRAKETHQQQQHKQTPIVVLKWTDVMWWPSMFGGAQNDCLVISPCIYIWLLCAVFGQPWTDHRVDHNTRYGVHR